MSDRPNSPSEGGPARIPLRAEAVNIQLHGLAIGTDNIHHDVFLSPRFVELAQRYIRDLVAQAGNLSQFFGLSSRSTRAPETSVFRKHLADLMQGSLARAQFEKSIEIDLLFRVALLKLFTQEISTQFTDALTQCKDWIRSRGDFFERSEQAHVLRSRLAELQADRRNVYRNVGQQLYQILAEIDDALLAKSRHALFGDAHAGVYAVLRNRLVFVEGGKDDQLFLDHYVMVGNFVRDADRFEVIEGILLDILRERVVADPQGEEMSAAWREFDELTDRALRIRAELANLDEERDVRLAKLDRGNDLLAKLTGGRDPTRHTIALEQIERRRTQLELQMNELVPQLDAAKRRADFLSEQYHARLGDFLNAPENARRLFDPEWKEPGQEGFVSTRQRLLAEWVERLRQRDLLPPILASYELKNIYRDYCPPVHLQQLRRALVMVSELDRVEDILKQFPARRFSLRRIEESARIVRRFPRDQQAVAAVRFAEDFMRLRRDLENYKRLVALMERVRLVRDERERELSRLNNSLYEYLLQEELRPQEERVVTHVVIKADVRGSSKITQDLLARGLNPASHFSLHLHEPVKGILDRYGAAKVFIEGDAIILAIYETDASRTHQRAVGRACVLARKIVELSAAYNDRAQSSDLPRLELGLGVAFQPSPPTYWMDGESRIMISRALNLSDRLSSCAKLTKRILGQVSSPFHVFVFQTSVEGAEEEEIEELLIRYNMNGIEINEEGFQKLNEEIALRRVEQDVTMPWGTERTTFFLGDVVLGEFFEPVILRQGRTHLLQPDGKIGAASQYVYYEVCADPKVNELLKDHLAAGAAKPVKH